MGFTSPIDYGSQTIIGETEPKKGCQRLGKSFMVDFQHEFQILEPLQRGQIMKIIPKFSSMKSNFANDFICLLNLQ